MEISFKGLNCNGASWYCGIDRNVDRDIGKVGEIIEFTGWNVFIISIDTNTRRKLWHYKNQIQRKSRREFIINRDLI
jgi:G:T-mismatch repair DNA endonuclease (very short patch repair protein)